MTHRDLPPDGALIERLRAGDEGALDLLLQAYWGPLCQYAEGILGGGIDPQDVVQEVFVRLWRLRERWVAEGSIRALMYKVTRNAALDERRRRSRQQRVAEEAESHAGIADPSDDAVASDLRVAAADAVSRLPPKRQEVFRLSREEGLTYAEIAAVMEVSPQTVANQMSLALADLRRELAPYLTEPAPP